MSQLPDDTTIKKQLSTDPERAIEWLFKAYFPYLCTTIYQFIPSGPVAEDLAQDVFFDLWRRRTEIQIKGSLKAYLRKAAINKALNKIRDNKQESSYEPLPEARSPIPLPLEVKELSQQIDWAIDQLPERCRLVFLLSRYEDLTYKEIAQKLDISEKTVENQIVKALKLLRQYLGPYLSSILLILMKIYFSS